MKQFSLILAILALLGLQVAFAQTREISGIVSSADDGSPIPGATVMVKGTTVGTVTDMDGKFSLQVPADATTVSVNFVGLEPQEVTLTSASTYQIKMESGYVAVDEVVVTAMGIRKSAKALGYATSSVGADELVQSGETNVIQALAAKTSGVQVIGSAGVPGASSKILIRGNSSFTGENQPLILIDGIPVDNQTKQTRAGDYPYNKNLEGVNSSNRAMDINPEDIESVSILKGPAAAALYGVRAANGAILYTTKKGAKGKLRASYEYKVDISSVNKLPEFQNKYSRGNNGNFTDDPKGSYDSWGDKMSNLKMNPTNNVENFFQKGLSQIHNITMMGGNAKSNFRLSLSNLDQNGMIPNTYLKKTSVRITGETMVTNDFKIGGTANYIRSSGNKGQNGSNTSGLMLSLFRAPVSYNLNDPELGGYETPEGKQRKYFSGFDNPLWSLYNNTFVENVDRVIGNFFANYKYKFLQFDYKLGTDVYIDSRKGIYAIGSEGGGAGGMGEVIENNIRNRELYSNFIINASGALNDDAFGSISIGHNLNEQNYKSLYGRGRSMSAPDFYHLSNASDHYADEESIMVRTSAFFFIADIDYKNMLFVNATGRNEWASTLGAAKQDFFYPSVSGSFIFTELLPKNPTLTFGKMRLGWAKAGNNPDPYSTSSYYEQPYTAAGMTDGLGWPYLNQNGFSKSSIIGNSELRPEMTTGYEAGLDLRFFDGRVTADLTYYNQKTIDILVMRPIAPSTGYSAMWQNSGEMVNNGFEVSLGVTPIKYKDFSWDINLNFTKNVNKVLKLAEGVDEIDIESAFTSIGSYAIVGQPYGALYGEKWKRDKNGNLIIGENGLPIKDPERGNIGNPFPDWLMNVRNTFNYKSLSLTFLFDIRKGGDIWAGTYARLTRHGRTGITEDRDEKIVIDGVKEDGSKNDIPISKENYYKNFLGDFGAVEQAVYDGSWVRLRDLTLSYKYKVPNNSQFGKYISSVSISATGRNLWLLTDYPGVDPETSLTGAGSNLTGFDYFNMPGSKSYLFGIKVDF